MAMTTASPSTKAQKENLIWPVRDGFLAGIRDSRSSIARDSRWCHRGAPHQRANTMRYESRMLRMHEARLSDVQLLVHRELAILMCRAIAGLRAETDFPRPVVEAQVGTALAIGTVDETAHVKCAAATGHHQVLLLAQEDGLKIDFSAGYAVLIVVNRTERNVDRMEAMKHQPARRIAFDDDGAAIAEIVAGGDEKMRAWPQAQIEAALRAAEVEPRLVTGAGIQRRIEAAADPELIAGDSSEYTDIFRDALVELKAFLCGAVLVAAVAAEETRYRESALVGNLEEIGIKIIEAVLCVRRCRKRDQQQYA